MEVALVEQIRARPPKPCGKRKNLVVRVGCFQPIYFQRHQYLETVGGLNFNEPQSGFYEESKNSVVVHTGGHAAVLDHVEPVAGNVINLGGASRIKPRDCFLLLTFSVTTASICAILLLHPDSSLTLPNSSFIGAFN